MRLFRKSLPRRPAARRARWQVNSIFAVLALICIAIAGFSYGHVPLAETLVAGLIAAANAALAVRRSPS